MHVKCRVNRFGTKRGPSFRGVFTRDFQDLDCGCERLAVRGRRLDFLDDIHAFDDPAEGCETLAIGVALTAKIEFRLIADADEEFVLGRVRTVAGHRKRAVLVLGGGYLNIHGTDAVGSKNARLRECDAGQRMV